MKGKKTASRRNRRTEALAGGLDDILAPLLGAALIQGKPADRVLRSLLRQRSGMGPRDRRLVAQTAFSLFRWWGWLRELAPEPFRSGPSSHSRAEAPLEGKPFANAAERRQWNALLFAAQFMEWDRPPPTARILASRAGAAPTGADRLWHGAPPKSPAKRMARLSSLLLNENRPPEKWRAVDLIPAWSRSRIASPRPLGELVRWLQTPPPLWLRLQTRSEDRGLRDLRESGFRVQRCVRLGGSTAAAVTGETDVFRIAAYQQGRIEVQDLASQCVGAVCAPEPGQRWWDACAGGGGKALLLADRMRGKGQVVASDIREYKLKDLRRRARRAGLHNIVPRPWDGSSVDRRRGNFHGVLVDAPCSGSGTWRRNPDARWSADAEETDRLAELQLAILKRAAGAVRPGGVLLYATCSMFRQENEDVATAFLREEEGFVLEPFTDPLTGERTEGMLQIWPWTADSDAMFVARMRREQNSTSDPASP